MLFPLAVALFSVLGGTALGLVPRERARAMVAVRWLAVAASLLVVAGHLLPEAFEALGWLAAVAFAVGLTLPVVAERLALAVASASFPSVVHGATGTEEHRTSAHQAASASAALAALEMGYAGLVLHRFGDGLAMGAAWANGGAAWGRVGVVIAISAHIVPVTTVMVLALAAARGARTAAYRGVALAVSTGGGVYAAVLAAGSASAAYGSVGGPSTAHALGAAAQGSASHAHATTAAEPWISAIVAGLLVHIVTQHGHGHGHATKASFPALSSGDAGEK